MIVGHWIR